MAVKKHSHRKWINYWGSRQTPETCNNYHESQRILQFSLIFTADIFLLSDNSMKAIRTAFDELQKLKTA